jgi:hypothetical protein
MNDKIIKKEFDLSVLNIFKNKGTMASIAEKTLINCNAKSVPENFYYFAVQHAFRQIDQEQVFKIDEQTSKRADYVALDFEHFKSITDDLKIVLNNLRNLNEHYMHTFNSIKESEISPGVIRFLKESFRLAVVQSFINEKISREGNRQIGAPLTGEQKKEIVKACLTNEKKIVYFLKTMFYQHLYVKKRNEKDDSFEERKKRNKDKIDFINKYCNNNLAKAIDFILFVETDKSFEWILNPNSNDSTNGQILITNGRYLSFNAMLFLFSMFLYKNEANTLIPRISGFKKNGTLEDRRKLNVFLFYAKKFGSQEVNCKNKRLIFFHDIMQYIGKFPLDWNNALEGEETETLKKFKEAIYRQEIEKQFSTLIDDQDFKKFALEYFFEEKHRNEKHIFRDLIEKENDIIKIYQDISAKNLNSKIYEDIYNYDYFIAQYLINKFYADDIDLKNYCNNKIPDKFYFRYEQKFNENKSTANLKNRIAHNLVILSYARNQDCFLEFCIRFLAENNYFGDKAQFKMYKYYSSLEQQEIYETLDEKVKDKLKFKGGKEVEYKTYAESQETYPEWDAPFVVENNAVFVKLQNSGRAITIQRDLIIYFMEDALFSENIENRGYKMLQDYFEKLDKEKTDAMDILEQQNTIEKEEKTGFKKILPRRLLNNYLAAEQNNPNSDNTMRQILKNAEAQEKRYEYLRKKAIYSDKLQAEYPAKTNIEKLREALFDDKNKGKNFKLTFIRKACNIMYFREIYKQTLERRGEHHKRFHITRDEYNDFCKWMCTFDAIPYYKIRLTALFESKGFFENDEFRAIIEESENLNDIYEKVKQKYRDWLTQNENTVKKGKYDLGAYDNLLNNGVRYINLWHFKQFLAEKGILKQENGKFIYPSLDNKEYLFSEYYIEKPTQKTQMKLWNDLKKARHEDCLLYELAMRYFNEDTTVTQQERTSVQTILNTELQFTQKYEQTKTYTVSVPIKDINRWIELKKFSKTQYLLKRLPVYLDKNRNSKELKNIALKFIKADKKTEIAFSDLNKVNNHIINNQAKFTCCIMALEKFYIQKKNLTLPEKGWLDIFNIEELKDYPYVKKLYDTAFHFDLPINKTYQEVFEEIEKRFAKEIRDSSSPYMYKEVLDVFLNKMRNDIFDKSAIYLDKSHKWKKETDSEKIRQKAFINYLEEMKQKINI